MKSFISFLSVTLLITCAVDPYPYELDEFEVSEDGYKCIVLGDWGRKGNTNLLANAYMMNEVACRHSIDAVLTTGDNFYGSGVESISDPLWEETFTQVFNGACLSTVAWWPSLGNHDMGGNVGAQVAYSGIDPRWNMPAVYYDRWVTSEDSATIHFVALNTTPLVSSDPDQLLWLDSVLIAGEPDWLVVYGHHPVYGAEGRHGSTEELIEQLVPRFKSHGVDVYFCGHNHSLELIRTEGRTLYVTSGAGSIPQDRIENLPTNLFGVAQAGFVLSTFTKDSLQLDFISKEGKRLYGYVSPQTL